MVKASGLIFIAILISIPLIFIDMFSGSGYLGFFAKEQSLNIMLTLLALNVAVVTFLLGLLTNLESKYNKAFVATRKELKDNIYFMTALVAINVVAVTANNTLSTAKLIDMPLPSILGWVSAVLVILTIIAMLEIVGVAFNIDGTVKNGKQLAQKPD